MLRYRPKRRRAKGGAFVHLFAGESREAFTLSAQGLSLEHIPVGVKDLCSSETYGFLLTLALSAALRVRIGGPPCRTYTVCRRKGRPRETWVRWVIPNRVRSSKNR